MDILNALADTLLSRLVWTSAQAMLLIGAVWLIGRLVPRLSSAQRCALWWLVGAQLLVGLCWSTPLQLPLLRPAIENGAAIAGTPASPLVAHAVWIAHATATPGAPTAAPATITSAWFSHWQHALLSLWLAALLAQVALAIRQWRASQRVLRESKPLDDDALQRQCAHQAQQWGLRQPPRLRLSTAIDSPQVVGLRRPTVLLPAIRPLTPTEAAMALGHELAHLRRGDLWLGWVPVLAQRLFFFHPLVRWAMREYALNREAACDEQVLQQAGTTPQAYGELLVRLGVARPLYSGIAGASPTFQNLKRRLIMLQQNENRTHRSNPAWLLIALTAVAGILPYRVTAGSTHPVQTAAPSVPPAPPTAPGALPPPPPPPPPGSMPPPPPPPVPPPPAPDFAGHHFHNLSIDTDGHANEGFVLIDGDSLQVVGSDADTDFARTAAASTYIPTLWLRQGTQHYVTHDRVTIERVRMAYAPLTQAAEDESKMASREGKLAGREGGLAAQEGTLASLQGELAGKQADLAGQQAELQAAAISTNGKLSDEQQAHLQSMHAQEQRIQAEMTRLRARQLDQRKVIDAKRHDLDMQRAAIARQREALSGQREKAQRQARQQVRTILADALAQGTFKRLD